MWYYSLFYVFMFQCLSNNIFIKKIQLPFQHWKNSTIQKINWPKNWHIIPYELQPFEMDFLITIQ